MAQKPKQRVITLKVNDIDQIMSHFNHRHDRAKQQRKNFDGTPFGVLRFWR